MAHELNIVLDKAAPETTISASDQLIDNVVNTVTQATFFTLHSADALSGVRTTAYRIDEGPWQSYTGSFNLAEQGAGQHAIAYKAIDNVLNEEAEKTLTIRLLVIKSVKKSIAADSVILVGIWSDKSDLEQKQSDLAKLDALLRSLQVTYTIATTTEEFTTALRSGRYNTYILIDVKEPVLSEEVREAVYAGDGLIFLKTRQDADPFLDNLFGAKLTGRTTTSDLTADLVSSPISNGGALQISGKAIIASLVSDTAQAYAYAPDKQETTPVIIFNQHGRGRAILYTFDLLASPDESTASALMVNSIGQVRPLEKTITSMDSVPVRISVENSGEPAELRIVETIPEGTDADTIVPQSDILNGTMTWQKPLASNERARFDYVLNLPDRAGDYTTRTEIAYNNNGIFVLYGTYDLAMNVARNSEELLRELISSLTNITMTSTIDAEKVNNAISSLHSVTTDASSVKTAEENIKSILNAAGQVQKLAIDASEIRLMLSELIGIWQKKWYILSTNPL